MLSKKERKLFERGELSADLLSLKASDTLGEFRSSVMEGDLGITALPGRAMDGDLDSAPLSERCITGGGDRLGAKIKKKGVSILQTVFLKKGILTNFNRLSKNGAARAAAYGISVSGAHGDMCRPRTRNCPDMSFRTSLSLSLSNVFLPCDFCDKLMRL